MVTKGMVLRQLFFREALRLIKLNLIWLLLFLNSCFCGKCVLF